MRIFSSTCCADTRRRLVPQFDRMAGHPRPRDRGTKLTMHKLTEYRLRWGRWGFFSGALMLAIALLAHFQDLGAGLDVVVVLWVGLVFWMGNAGDNRLARWCACSILVVLGVWFLVWALMLKTNLDGYSLSADDIMISAMLTFPFGAILGLWMGAPIIWRRPSNEHTFWMRFSLVFGALLWLILVPLLVYLIDHANGPQPLIDQ